MSDRLEEIRKRCDAFDKSKWEQTLFNGNVIDVFDSEDSPLLKQTLGEDIPYLLSELEKANQIVYECERTNEKCCKKIISLEAKLEKAEMQSQVDVDALMLMQNVALKKELEKKNKTIDEITSGLREELRSELIIQMSKDVEIYKKALELATNDLWHLDATKFNAQYWLDKAKEVKA